MSRQMAYRVDVELLSKLITNWESLPAGDLKSEYCIKGRKYSTLNELRKILRVCKKPDYKVPLSVSASKTSRV